MSKSWRRLYRITAAVVSTAGLGLALAPQSRAASGRWNVDADGNWSTPGNWQFSVVADGAGSQAQFDHNITTARTVTLDTNRTIGSLLFADFGQAGSPWTLQASGGSVLTLSGGGGISAIDARTDATISAPMTGTNGIFVTGSSSPPTVLTLTGSNSYQGPTIIDMVGGSALGAIDGVGLPTASNMVLTEGTFQSSGTFTRALGSGPGQVRWSNGPGDRAGFSAFGGTLAVQIGGNTNPITWGTPDFVSNSSDLRLNATRADSVVDFQNGINLNGATRRIFVGDNPNLTTDAAQISGPITNGNLELSGGKMILTGANTYSETRFGVSTIRTVLQIGNDGTTGTLGTGPVNMSTGSQTIIFNRSNDYTVANEFSASSPDLLQQAGTGTTTLDTNFPADVLVSAGTLLVNQDVGTATVDGGTLGGNGEVLGPLVVNAGGTLAPGASVGTLDTLRVTFAAATSVFAAEIDLGPTLDADLLNVSDAGQVILGGATLDLSLLNVPSGQALPLTFLLIDNDGTDQVDGVFGTTNVSPGFAATLDYDFTGTDALGRVGDGNDVAVTIVPEPATSLVLPAVATLTLVRRRQYPCR